MTPHPPLSRLIQLLQMLCTTKPSRPTEERRTINSKGNTTLKGVPKKRGALKRGTIKKAGRPHTNPRQKIAQSSSDWLAWLLETPPQPMSSQLIASILFCKNVYNNDTHGDRMMKEVKSFKIECDLEREHQHGDDLAVSFIFGKFYPQMIRRGESSVRCPIVLDGCREASGFKPEFAPKWIIPTEAQDFSEDKVLTIWPLVCLALRWSLLGHRVRIALPNYYKVPYIKEQRLLKVTDLYSFTTMEKLGMFSFVDPSGDSDSMKWIEQQQFYATGPFFLYWSVIDDRTYQPREPQRCTLDERYNPKGEKQLLLKEQVHQVLQLIQLYYVALDDNIAVIMLLKFAMLQGILLDEINAFIAKNELYKWAEEPGQRAEHSLHLPKKEDIEQAETRHFVMEDKKPIELKHEATSGSDDSKWDSSSDISV